MNTEDVQSSNHSADAQDVWNIYNLILRRDPESKTVIQLRVGHSLEDVLASFLRSPEFSAHVLSALIAHESHLVPYRGTMSLGHLLVWANARLPVRSELRDRLLGVRSWVELDEMLFLDQELRHYFPQLAERADGDQTRSRP